MPTIAILGTLDTKGDEHGFVAAQIRAHGHGTLVIDVGTDQPPRITTDISREEVALIAGIDLASLTARHDRGECVAAMADAAAKVLTKLHAEGKIDGVISLGGGGGTAIATAGMRALPLGFPKLMVSTLASGNTAPYVGVMDIVMFPAIVDVAGINRISRMILTRSAGAICGMVETAADEKNQKSEPSVARQPRAQVGQIRNQKSPDRPIVVASMFGNTTDCVQRAKSLVEAAGFEVLVFHATGTGGRTMESLIESGMVAGVLDITTTEWADELVGGVLGAGPTRLDAAAKTGTPAIVTPGCLDMVNFGPRETVPAKFSARRFYQHNPQVTLMRTTPDECAVLGRILAQKVNAYRGPVTILLPLRAISIISAPGGAFHWPEADAALFGAIKKHLRSDIPLIELEEAINAPAFADACAQTLLGQMRAQV